MSRTLRLDIALPEGVTELEALATLDESLAASDSNSLAVALRQQITVARLVSDEPPRQQSRLPENTGIEPAWQTGMPFRYVLPVLTRAEAPSMTPTQVMQVMKLALQARRAHLRDPVLYVLRTRGGQQTEIESAEEFEKIVKNLTWQGSVCKELLANIEQAHFDIG